MRGPIDAAELDQRVATEYRRARERMQELATSVDDETAGQRVVPACPAWTVRDLLAHVTGIAVDLSADRRPTGDTQAWVDRQIDERRERRVADIAAEWGVGGPQFEAMIAAKPHRWWGLTYDVVVHEHDLRGALGRTDARDSEAVRTAALLGLRLVETDLAKAALPAFRAVLDGDEIVVGDGSPELTLEASAFEALRLLGSRRTLEEMRAARFTGDLDRYLPGLVHMQLPTAPLAE